MCSIILPLHLRQLKETIERKQEKETVTEKNLLLFFYFSFSFATFLFFSFRSSLPLLFFHLLIILSSLSLSPHTVALLPSFTFLFFFFLHFLFIRELPCLLIFSSSCFLFPFLCILSTSSLCCRTLLSSSLSLFFTIFFLFIRQFFFLFFLSYFPLFPLPLSLYSFHIISLISSPPFLFLFFLFNADRSLLPIFSPSSFLLPFLYYFHIPSFPSYCFPFLHLLSPFLLLLFFQCFLFLCDLAFLPFLSCSSFF